MKAKWKMILALSVVAVLVALPAYRIFFYAPPVAVIQAEEGKVALEVRGPGVVASRIQVTVSTRVTGILKALHADQGDSVKAGQLLALLDPVDLDDRVASGRIAVERAGSAALDPLECLDG